ncbi:aldolase/citrate lyase family protein, partial [Salmonella enterica subsp. enterica serovar Kentucky]|nr:aldolase/citrate lyase family protein [Salmonella enterica subsp. enterica serovar Kentucky]
LAGFDWLVLDGEHAPNDVTTLIPQLMALKGSASAPVVRVPTNGPVPDGGKKAEPTGINININIDSSSHSVDNSKHINNSRSHVD